MKLSLSLKKIQLEFKIAFLETVAKSRSFKWLTEIVAVGILILLSIASTIISFHKGYIVAYNDARAHMDMARLAIDNLNPGLAQIGSVWLPLNHLLTLTLVWNDWLWHTGLAGALYSMIFYVLSGVVIFKLTKLAIKDTFAAILGTLVFATNLNILYMQSTPMTELTLIFFFVATTYFLYKWVVTDRLLDLIYTAVCVLLATLTRYDGWFLFVIVTLIVFLNSSLKYFLKGKSIKENVSSFFKNTGIIEGKTILFLTLAGLGIVLWLLWNLAIFKNALYFANGPYSAQAQQQKIEQAGGLLTKHNLPLSIAAYWWAMVDNSGFLLLVFSAIGFIIYTLKNKFDAKALALYTLLVPIGFHLISLYTGQSIVVLPELGVNFTQKASASWFNVRYGLMILPAVAFFAAYLASKDKIIKMVLVALIIIQPLIFFSTKNIITLTDGLVGTSSLDVGGVASWLATNTKNDNGLILTSISFNNALAFTTGLPLKRFIHEGTGHYWETSLVDPAVYAKWIVMANGDVGDPVYNALINNENSAFLKKFRLVKRFEHLNVYERIDVPENFVYTESDEFKVNGETFRFVGVNSYDLIYRTPQQINETLNDAANAGVKVVRFWAFGDGNQDGIQPNAGIYSQDALNNLDLVMATAKQHNLKVIVTFVNYWPDYGGMAQYLKWNNLPNTTPNDLDRFYTDTSTKKLYEQYVKMLVNRKNSVTGIVYKDDPTIFAWELANEPRSSSTATSSLVVTWADEMSSYIHSLDKAHLVLSGAEGFLSNPAYTSTQVGPSFEDIAKQNPFTGLTAHYYIQNVNLITPDYRHPALSEWKREADIYSKPMILEEVGFSKNILNNNNVDRLTLFKNLFDEAQGHGVQGVILWNWALVEDNNFGISPKDPRDQKIIDLIRNYSQKLDQNSTK